MKKRKNSIGGGLFRVTAEIAHNNKMSWIVFLTFPGQARYVLKNEEDRPIKHESRDHALFAGVMAMPGVLSKYYADRGDVEANVKAAVEIGEKLFTLPDADGVNLSKEHKVNKPLLSLKKVGGKTDA